MRVAGKTGYIARELDAALAVLASFDEGADLVLYCKYLMVLEGDEQYAYHFNPTDKLSASQQAYVRDQWQLLAETYIDEMPALSPVGATGMGDHRFDRQLDDVSAASRATKAAFIRRYQNAMAATSISCGRPAGAISPVVGASA